MACPKIGQPPNDDGLSYMFLMQTAILVPLRGEEGEHEVMWEEFARMACNMVPWCHRIGFPANLG